MFRKWRCSQCTIFGWLETDFYQGAEALLTELRRSHRVKSPYCSQEVPDIFGQFQGPFSAEIMPFLDWVESDLHFLELKANGPNAYLLDRQAKAQIATLKESLLTADHTLGLDGLSVEAGKRIANHWNRLNMLEEKLSPRSKTAIIPI